MDIDFWKQRWTENQIGFHLPEVNTYITSYWTDLLIEPPATVLVPLCGKTLDMAWLVSKGYSVIGIECSQKAVMEFLDEQQITATTSKYKAYRVHEHSRIKLLEGDFFDIDSEILKKVSAVYDRASLIALPENLRSKYVDVLINCLPENCSILLVTVEYQQNLMSGPPFSVSHNEVEALYQNSFDIKLLHQQDIIEESPEFRQNGLNTLIERVYKISR